MSRATDPTRDRPIACSLGLTHQRLVPLAVGLVPVDELADALAAVPRGFVAQQSVGLRDVGVSVFGVGFSDFGVLELEFGREFVTDDLCQGLDVDGVGAADVDELAVGRVLGEEGVGAVDDVVDVGEVPRLVT